MKKFILTFILFTTIFLLKPLIAHAENPCGITMEEIPRNIGSQTTLLRLRFSGIDATANSYELILGYYEPVPGRSGHVNDWFNYGEWKTQTLGSLSSTTIDIQKGTYPQAFFMDGNNYSSERTISVIKRTNGQSDITCELSSYFVRSSAVVNSVTACGYPGTTGLRGSEGGCVDYQKCTSGRSQGYYCVCDDECESLQSEHGGKPPVDETGGTALPVLACGQTTQNPSQRCLCWASGTTLRNLGEPAGYCCGWGHVQACYGSLENYNAAIGIAGGDTTIPVPPQGPVTTAPSESEDDTSEETGDNGGLDIFAGPSSADFKDLNPLRGMPQLSSPGGIISRILLFAFPLGGLILFTMLVWGGFEMLVGATGKGIDAGKQRVTNAVIGFFLLFISYWVFQIVEVIFGLQIL